MARHSPCILHFSKPTPGWQRFEHGFLSITARIATTFAAPDPATRSVHGRFATDRRDCRHHFHVRAANDRAIGDTGVYWGTFFRPGELSGSSSWNNGHGSPLCVGHRLSGDIFGGRNSSRISRRQGHGPSDALENLKTLALPVAFNSRGLSESTSISLLASSSNHFADSGGLVAVSWAGRPGHQSGEGPADHLEYH